MQEFDFAACQRERLYPEYKKLPDAIKALYRRVQLEAAGLHQDKDLAMPWPENDLEATFMSLIEKHGPELIDRASEVIYYLGHFDSKQAGDLDFPRDSIGGYWKFQHYVRQCLVEVGYREPHPELYGRDEFMVHKEGTSYSDDEIPALLAPLVAPELSVEKVLCCNYKVGGYPGHPFTIGAKHMSGDSIYLDPRRAPCAQRGCGRDYDEHTHDRVLILKLARPAESDDVDLTEVEKTKIKKLAPELEKHKIDGIAFTK